MRYATTALTAVALALFATAGTVRADEEDGIVSFKTSKARETEEFVKKAVTPVVKAARLKPADVTVKSYKYHKVKEGRSELKIAVSYKGAVSGKVYNADITFLIDNSTDQWEVLNILYKDDNKVSLMSPNEKNIQALIKKFNK